MATRAALFIQTDTGDWLEVYNHYDGAPADMLPALAAHDPQAIIDAREIRGITTLAIDAFEPARAPARVARPAFPEWASHAYVLTATGWAHAADQRGIEAIIAD